MDLLDIVRQAQGGQAIANMARAFDLTPEQAEAAVAAVIPELGRGIERNTLSRGGVADLVAALGDRRHVQRLNDPAMFADTSIQSDGNAILAHILGTKDASRAAAQRASLSSGIGEGLIKMLLPYIAQILMGALAGKTQGSLGDILSKIPGMPGTTGNNGGQGGVSFPPPRSQTRRSAPTPGNTNAGNAPTSGPGSFETQQPLPIPTGLPPDSDGDGRNPYGDLSDIIRDGGKAKAPTAAGGSLASIIRDMLGGALGFSTKGGVMGWIFRAVVLRYGWGILRSILGSVLGGRR